MQCSKKAKTTFNALQRSLHLRSEYDAKYCVIQKIKEMGWKLFLAFLILMVQNSFCQKYEPMLINKKSAGALIEFGTPYFIDEDITYNPLLIGGIFELPLFKAKNNFNISLSFYPHAGIAYIPDSIAYEFGMNIRMNLNLALSKYDVVTGVIAAGPHYINYCNCRQATGFLFSDNIILMYRRYFEAAGNYCSFTFEIGYRHISNANFKEPNDGISNIFVGTGFYIIIGSVE